MSLLQAREELSLTHFSYSEWPVSGGEDAEGGLVPSATHGILGLVEHALAHQEEASLTGPIAVHCRSVHTNNLRRECSLFGYHGFRYVIIHKQALLIYLEV